MTKKVETLVNMYYKVLELYQSDSITDKANIRIKQNLVACRIYTC